MKLIKKTLLALLLLATSFHVHGQEEKQSKFQFGVEIGVNAFEKSITQTNQFSFIGPSQSQPRHQEYTANFIGAIKIKEAIFLKSGVGYKYRTERVIMEGLVFGTDIDPSTGVTASTDIDVRSRLHYLNVPVGVLFQLDVNIKVDLGVELEFFIDDSSTKKISTTSGNPDPAIESLNFDLDNGSVFNPYLAVEFEILDFFYAKPIINFHKNPDWVNWYISGGIRIGKMF